MYINISFKDSFINVGQISSEMKRESIRGLATPRRINEVGPYARFLRKGLQILRNNQASRLASAQENDLYSENN